jgi:phage terminase large subunit-like protein
MFRKRLHPILIIPIILVLRASGTTVVVYRSPTQIVVGADTLLLVSKGAGFDRRRMCKIRSSRGIYFAAAGLTKNARAGYSVVSLAERACASSRNVIDAAKRFELLSLKPFETIARRYQRKSPEFYRAQIKEKPEPLQVVFMGIDRDVPTFALVTFTTSETKGLVSVTPHIKVCPGVECPTGETVTILGENINADRATHDRSFFRELRHDPQSMLHRLVEMEATADPSRVSAPFDILTISARGSEWDEHGYCR